MSRPVQADAEATRRRILAAAGRLFSLHGEGGSTMRQISSEAGVSMATVHHYFGSKAELYHACIQAMGRELDDLRAALEPAFAAGLDPTEVIERAVGLTYAFARRHRPFVKLMMRTVLDRGELDPGHRDQVLLPFLERGSAVLAPPLGRPVQGVRLALLSVTYLIVRFALNSPPEQARITGTPRGEEAEAERAVEEHLAAAARALLASCGNTRHGKN